MNILFLCYKENSGQRNPIPLLDLSPYYRKLGHKVVCRFINEAEPKEYIEADIILFSVLHSFNKSPVLDSLNINNKYKKKVYIGGKWAKTNTELSTEDTLVTDINGEDFFGEMKCNFNEYPSWELNDFKTLKDVKSEIMSTRGCPYRCHFCNNTEKKIKYFSVKRTADNIELLNSLGVRNIFIVDDIFTLNTDRMYFLLDELKSRSFSFPNFKFFSHISFTNDNTIQAIKKYTPYTVEFGIESGDNEQLKNMGKTFTKEEAEDKLFRLKENNIPVTGLFLLGFPGESYSSLENTFNFIKKTLSCYNKLHASFYQPIKGTIGYEMALKRMPDFAETKENTQISYIDPNLNVEILQQYKNKILSLK
jgi:radical SAM superfamily enzyme YgiQ (UPF0313 family)